MRKRVFGLAFAAVSAGSLAVAMPAVAADYQPRPRQPAYMPPPPQPVYQQPAYYPPPPVQSSCCCPAVRRGLFSFTVGCGGSHMQYPPYAQPYPAAAPAYYPPQPYPAYQPTYYQPGYAPQVGVGVGVGPVGVGVGVGYPRY